MHGRPASLVLLVLLLLLLKISLLLLLLLLFVFSLEKCECTSHLNHCTNPILYFGIPCSETYV